MLNFYGSFFTLISKICLFILTWSTNVTDRQTDTACRHIPRLCIASRSKNRIFRSGQKQKWNGLQEFPTCQKFIFGAQKCLLRVGHVWFKSVGKSNSRVPKKRNWEPPHTLPINTTYDLIDLPYLDKQRSWNLWSRTPQLTLAKVLAATYVFIQTTRHVSGTTFWFSDTDRHAHWKLYQLLLPWLVITVYKTA